MTSRQMYEAVLIEMNKENATNILLEDFNYFINKAINQYINKRYNIYDISLQTTDDLRVLKATAVLVPRKVDNTYDGLTLAANGMATYYVDLPHDYLHLLNCIVIYNVNKTYKCYNKGDTWRVAATRLTADAYSLVLDNFWMKPSYKRPYYYIHNVNTSGNNEEELILNYYDEATLNGTDANYHPYSEGNIPLISSNKKLNIVTKKDRIYFMRNNKKIYIDNLGLVIINRGKMAIDGNYDNLSEENTNLRYFYLLDDLSNGCLVYNSYTQEFEFSYSTIIPLTIIVNNKEVLLPGLSTIVNNGIISFHDYVISLNGYIDEDYPNNAEEIAFYLKELKAIQEGLINNLDEDYFNNKVISISNKMFSKNYGNETSNIQKTGKLRYGNVSKVRMEIRYGTDNSVFSLDHSPNDKGGLVYVDYIKAPQFIRLTQEEVDYTEDRSQMLEFPDYVCQEIINELVLILMENLRDQRVSTHPVVSLSIANPAQALAPAAAG